MQSPQAATVPIFRVLMRFWLPIRPGGLPMCRRRFPYHMAFPIRFRGSPMRFCGLPHTGYLLIGFVVSPYGHTPDEFPHTFWQIPTGRPFSHSHGRSPIAWPSLHTIHNLLKVGLSFDETSVPVPQTPNQPRQANILDLRYCTTNQAPTGSSK